MKKLILIFTLCLFSISIYADGPLVKGYETAKEKARSFVSEKTEPDINPYSGDKLRPNWEIEAGFNWAFFPSNGPSQMRTDALTVELIHNMSNVFGAYVKYAIQRYEKFEYEGSSFDKEWNNYSVTGGFQLYIMPRFRLYAGAGKLYASDKEGSEPDLGSAIEKGIKYDFPIKGYKITVGYATVDAQMSEERPNVSESTGDQTHSFISTTLSIPL